MQKRSKNDPKSTPKRSKKTQKGSKNDWKLCKTTENDAKTNMSVQQLKDSFYIFLDEDIDRFNKSQL